ncbi:hypothetical protein [Salinibacter ruber]|jgi:hypothetical protein|uniref:Uncharacterized protein n=2 Tax=Salinibacter ruber TaxID=146919 RepID=A0A9X2UIZ7_9BACT|nr:hypothetical protein [Salinibacter ruber]MBB4089757.1 hypothetical protein [Salinibacter ruber]MCS3610257.1 hypothetical protein [Salinibacter ruber]MCS3614876.1 hypothetical protein [Salinibacter ruber]MCS3647686.1 hypothetical protein [Salinibacter ruber]MCS3671192.1 hypothetical protein [Salinibacter ruber]
MNRYCTAVLALFLTAGLMLPGSALADDPEPADDSTNATSLVANAWESDNTTAAPQQDEPTLDVSINGSLRFNALFRSYGEQADKTLGDGGFTFDTFRIGANGSYGGLIFDSELAVYPESFGGVFLQKGWVGYEFSESRQIQVGVSQVPFGIQPYASSSWFFNSTYYVGLEDDYDAGVKAMFTPGNWDIQGAYYMNAEQTDFFAGSNFGRYSYDVVPVTSFPAFGDAGDANDVNGIGGYTVVPGGNSTRSPIAEAHQFNIKAAYSFDHGDLGFTKVGVSGQRGQLKNLSTGDTDWHAAYAAHFQGRYGGFGAKLEFAQQELNPPLTDAEQTAFNNQSNVDYSADDFVVMGAYNFPQRVAAKHTVYSSSVSYRIPVNVGPVSQIKPYYDFSLVTKDVEAWNDNATHDIGFLTSAGPLFVYTDLNISKGHPFNHPGANFASVMAENNDNEWRTAFNLNIGIYF